MKLLMEIKGVATIHAMEDEKIIILRWERFNVQLQFQEILNGIRKAFEDTKYNRVLVDTSETEGLISSENQKWMEEVHFPKLQEQSICKFVATVLPASSLGQMTNEKWQDTLVKIADMELINVPSREEGLEWLKKK